MSVDRQNARAVAAPKRAAVLTKTVIRAARLLNLSQAHLAQTLGVSEAATSRMHRGMHVLERGRGKEWELAALLVRLFRSLNSILGSEEKARAWLNSDNSALYGRPIDLIARTEGLVSVLHYVEAARGRI